MREDITYVTSSVIGWDFAEPWIETHTQVRPETDADQNKYFSMTQSIYILNHIGTTL